MHDVEAQDARALSRGMCGLGVRVARGLNCVMRRRGRVLAPVIEPDTFLMRKLC